MPRDAEATKARILTAAVAEFAAHGYAGGRIERIAREAGSNVRMIYAYFDGKNGLFDAALASGLRQLAEAVPPRLDDLPGWAGEIFDHHAEHPEALRLSLWAQLERPEAAAEPLDSYRNKIEAITGAGADPLTPVDLLVIIYAVAQAWHISPLALRNAEGDPTAPDRIAAHRQSVVTAVRRLLDAP